MVNQIKKCYQRCGLTELNCHIAPVIQIDEFGCFVGTTPVGASIQNRPENYKSHYNHIVSNTIFLYALQIKCTKFLNYFRKSHFKQPFHHHLTTLPASVVYSCDDRKDHESLVDISNKDFKSLKNLAE